MKKFFVLSIHRCNGYFVQKLRNKLKMASHYPLWEIHSATNRPPDLYNLWPKIVIGKISLSSAKS